MKKLIFICLLLLAGCEVDNDTPKNIANRQKEFNSGGYVVGTLNDGRKVTRYEIENNGLHNHWIYVVDSTSSVSTNFAVDAGDPDSNATRNETVVVVNGVQYVPAEKVE